MVSAVTGDFTTDQNNENLQQVNHAKSAQEQADVQKALKDRVKEIISSIDTKFNIKISEKDPVIVQHYINKIALQEMMAENYQFLDSLNKVVGILINQQASSSNKAEADNETKEILVQIKQDLQTNFNQIATFVDQDMCKSVNEMLTKFAPIIQGNEIENVKYIFTVNNVLEKMSGLTTSFNDSSSTLKKISNVIIGAGIANLFVITGFWCWMFFG